MKLESTIPGEASNQDLDNRCFWLKRYFLRYFSIFPLLHNLTYRDHDQKQLSNVSRQALILSSFMLFNILNICFIHPCEKTFMQNYISYPILPPRYHYLRQKKIVYTTSCCNDTSSNFSS